MPVHVCPRCQRTNPEAAAYCYFDGALLQGGAGNGAAVGQLGREFVFPSGRRCKSYDELALCCQEDWVAARDLLRQGAFQQFFGTLGRADLARAAQEAMAQQDGDIGLTSFLGSLPTSQTFQPQLDIHPRRLDLGKLLIGDTRRVAFTISNRGKGQLQGTIKVSEGSVWLSFPGGATSCPISAAKDQKISVEISTQKLVALQSYLGKLMVVTNGGIVEVPLRCDVGSRPFGKPPYQDVKTPREIAVQMRNQPKAAVPLLESGEVLRWFTSNNWNYPVQGQPAKGVAAVQQFFEAMGLSKAPPLSISQTEFRYCCTAPDAARFQVLLSTPARKWVYAWIESDKPWLKILTPLVSGPQKATISFEVDGRTLLHTPPVEAKLNILANAGQKLQVRVAVDSPGGPAASPPDGREAIVSAPGARRPRPTPVPSGSRKPASSFVAGMLAMALAFFLLRLGLSPVVDFGIRGADVRAAAGKLNHHVPADAPLARVGGWLSLPWTRILLGSGVMPATLFGATEGDVSVAEFRHYFVTYFTRDMVLWLWWLGPVCGLAWMRRSAGSWSDIPFALVAGTVAGIMIAATLACVFLVVDAVPHVLWGLVFSGDGKLLILWVILALICWTAVGCLLGVVCGVIGPLRQAVVEPVQDLLAGACRKCGLSGMASFWGRNSE